MTKPELDLIEWALKHGSQRDRRIAIELLLRFLEGNRF